MGHVNKCPNKECGSTNIREVGWDIYPTDNKGADVIEEEQYICNTCKLFFVQQISMIEGLIPIKVHFPEEKKDG